MGRCGCASGRLALQLVMSVWVAPHVQDAVEERRPASHWCAISAHGLVFHVKRLKGSEVQASFVATPAPRSTGRAAWSPFRRPPSHQQVRHRLRVRERAWIPASRQQAAVSRRAWPWAALAFHVKTGDTHCWPRCSTLITAAATACGSTVAWPHSSQRDGAQHSGTAPSLVCDPETPGMGGLASNASPALGRDRVSRETDDGHQQG
jgi:hypothetical protein